MKIVPEESIHSSENKEQDVELLLPNSKKKGKGIIPLHLFIVATISILILGGSLLLWGSSYALTRDAINELSNSLIKVSGEKIVGFLDGMLKPVSMETRSMAKEYMLSNLDFGINQQRGFLYSKVLDFNNNGVGYFFEKPYNARYTYTYPVSSSFMNYVYQAFGSPLSINDRINITTASVLKYNHTVSSTPYVNNVQPFYTYTVAQAKMLGVDGVYGDPYITGGVMTIYYSNLLYNPTLYQKNGTKELVGVAKINLSLIAVANYMSLITLLGRGYVVLAHSSGTCLGASIAVNQTTPSIFNLKDRNAGLLLRQFFNMNGNSTNFKNSTSYSIIGDSDGISYIITPIKYRLENIDWNIFFILYEEEVTATLRLTTYISIGVTAGVVIVGILASLIIGFVVSRPMKFLEKQFMLIKVFDLDHVVSNRSIFREVNSIFNNLDETIDWLKEIKSFVPGYALEQIQNSEQVQKSSNETETNDLRKSMTSHSHQSKSESGASFRSIGQSFKKASKSLFKMGLVENPTAVISIRIEAESRHLLEDAFNELVVVLGPVVKVSQGNLQIISYDHFQLSFTANQLDSKLSEKAFDTSVKILKACQTLKNSIKVRMGVSVKKCHSGNLGTSTSRHYMVVGKSVDQSEKFCEMASLFNVNIISDLESFHKSDKFITRPLDRISLDSDKIILWEVIDKKNEENDEWLYELERSKENNKFKELTKVFELFDEKYWESNREIEDVIAELGINISILEKFNSPSTEKLLNYFRNVYQHPSYSNISHLKESILNYSTVFISKKLS